MKKFIKGLLIITILLSTSKIYAEDIIIPECVLPQILVNNVCTDPIIIRTTPIITWSNPNDITDGTALSATQLNATTTVPGTFIYTPEIGAILPIGTQTLQVVFTPDDIVNYTTATATSTININATTGGNAHIPLNVNISVDVPTNCSVTDMDAVIHNYPEDGSLNQYLAICALDAAIKNGSISDVKLSNQYPSLGLFVTAISSAIADPNSQYWAIYQNGSYANTGMTLMKVMVGDVMMFQLHDFSDNNLGDQVTIQIRSLISNNTNSGGGNYVNNPINNIVKKTDEKIEEKKPTFDTKKALDFLITQQKEDGSFGEELYTDWATLALMSTDSYQDQKIKLIKYYTTYKKNTDILTENLRHSMAIMSLGLNPYNTNGENYIKKIIDSFDGTQIGNYKEDNDDIFALIVLQNAGLKNDEAIIQKIVSFIISRQKTNGSWDESVDMTGAAIASLSYLKDDVNIKPALEKAKEFLKQKQNINGGWENIASTSWAIMGINSLTENIEAWTTNTNNTPLTYVAMNQDIDGGVLDANLNNKIWNTSYLITSLTGKNWNKIMQTFQNKEAEVITNTIELKTIAPTEIKNANIKKEYLDNKKVIKKVEQLKVENDIKEIPNENKEIKRNWLMNFLYTVFNF